MVIEIQEGEKVADVLLSKIPLRVPLYCNKEVKQIMAEIQFKNTVFLSGKSKAGELIRKVQVQSYTEILVEALKVYHEQILVKK